MRKLIVLSMSFVFYLFLIISCSTQKDNYNVNTPSLQAKVITQAPSLDKMNNDLGKSMNVIINENQGATRYDNDTILLRKGGVSGTGQYYGYNWTFRGGYCIYVTYFFPYNEQEWNSWIENTNLIYGNGKILLDTNKREAVVLWFLNGGIKLNLVRGDINTPIIAWAIQNFPGYKIKEDDFKLLAGHDDLVWSVAFNNTGNQIASSSENSVKLWDAETGNELRTLLSGNKKGGMAVAFSPNGNNLAVGTFDNVIRVFNVNNGREILTLKSQESISSIAFSPDGSKIASVSGSLGDNTAKVWNASNGNLLINQTLGRINSFTGKPLASMQSVKFSPNGNSLIIADRFSGIIILDVNSGRVIRTISMVNEEVESIDVSRDGKIIVSGSRDSIKILDFDTGRLIRNLPIKNGVIRSVYFSYDNKTIISGGGDEGIRFWNVETGRISNTIIWNRADIMAMSLSPDGKKIVAGGGLLSGDYSLKIWNID